jgi:hypothetical protein
MNSGPQINDRLIALVNASPFRPFTLTLCRKWRIGSADQLYPGRRAAPAGWVETGVPGSQEVPLMRSAGVRENILGAIKRVG